MALQIFICLKFHCSHSAFQRDFWKKLRKMDPSQFGIIMDFFSATFSKNPFEVYYVNNEISKKETCRDPYWVPTKTKVVGLTFFQAFMSGPWT